jgi:tetratricopeptide (TPR) repeat protein
MTPIKDRAHAHLLREAVASHRAGRLGEAEHLYRAFLAEQPDAPDALFHFGILLAGKGDYDQAAALLQRATQLRPAAADLHANLGVVLDAAGRSEASVDSLRQAVTINPHHVLAQHQLGTVLRDLGRPEEAISAYRAALAVRPDLAETFSNLGLIWTWREGDELSEALLALAKRSDRLIPESRVHLLYAVGKYYDDIGDPDTAFSYWLKGAALKRRLLPSDTGVLERTVAQLIATFRPGIWAQRRDHGDPSKLPVFVLGMPRSGTSLIEQILGAHPHIHAAGELDLLRRCLDGLSLSPRELLAGPPNGGSLASELCRRGRAYVDSLTALAPTARRITNKLPGNYRHIGFIHLVLPNSQIIFCRRDLRDVAVSCFQTLFMVGHEWSYDLAELGRALVAFARLMEHWRAVLPNRFLDVAYEDIVVAPESESRRILAHCDVPWDDACREFRNTSRAVRTASTGQVRQPIHSRSVGRWRRYERHLGPLLDALSPLGLE